MDASASKIRNAEVDNLFGLYLKIENSAFPNIKTKRSVIKYTKLPDFDIKSNAQWFSQSYTLEPRIRKIITIEEPKIETRRSLRSDVAITSKIMPSDNCKRKIVTIEENDEYSLHPKFSQPIRKTNMNTINRTIEIDANEEKLIAQKKISRSSYTSKNLKDSQPKTKKKKNYKRETGSPKLFNKQKYSRGDNEIQGYAKNKISESTGNPKSSVSASKFSLSKKFIDSRECDKEVSTRKKKLYQEEKSKKPQPQRILEEKSRLNRSASNVNYNKISILKNIKEKSKPVTIIHVPLDETLISRDAATEVPEDSLNLIENGSFNVNSSVQVTETSKYKDKNIGTELITSTVDQVTEIDEDLIVNENCKNKLNKTFDSLDIPNVSLTNNNKHNVPKETFEIIGENNKSSSILEIPNINITSQKDDKKLIEPCFHKSTSYFIGRATLTYTTSQKINFHVVGSNETLQAHLPSSPYKYPMNVVSVYKQELQNKEYHDDRKKLDCDDEEKINKSYNEVEHSNGLTSFNCAYVFDDGKLVKPSDIIRTIKVNNSLLQSDYICEQFQRELNFIDSFFESLQYLESCSLSEKCITDKKVENWMSSGEQDLKNFEFGSFLSKFENEINVDDSKTMASKSLCLLNLLIRDEQRRAKNLLFVLKMREDALKDFTKSQILWLENKKKQDNTDISTLKKKQRGALLKLQHECGEMQRMRKALLTLSEKRKLAFMKTKKNIEIKLRNSVNVEQIILGKKKLKRNTSNDRNIAPLKCFELSSSGCDDSTTSRPKSNSCMLLPSIPKSITKAEKYVQTGESLPAIVSVDRSTDAGDENFVIVDGGYLNILFHNLSLPQIFSKEKQYEVNKEALNNIVNSSNMHHVSWNNDTFEEIMDQRKNELDRSSSPSTARSLVEEFDQIYKGFNEEHSHDKSTPDRVLQNSAIEEVKTSVAQGLVTDEDSQIVQKLLAIEKNEDILIKTNNDLSVDESCMCEPFMISVGIQSSRGKEAVNVSVSGPLPVPAGAAAVSDDSPTIVPTWLAQNPSTSSFADSSSSSSQPLCPSISSMTSPVHYEAEELRRQQLAIEREIQALEQQQCQLLAVREIPDKPPPPYTPPSEPRAPKPPRKFAIDDTIEEQIRAIIPETKIIIHEANFDPFDIFVKDFCEESIQRQKLAKSEKYWDTCNLPPSKPELNTEKLIKKTALELKEVITSVPPSVVSGVGARRSDHIDDILFAEWRRCEPEWTSLHVDEVIVKNQVFESIFQKILSETIDEYKKTVLDPPQNKKYI